MKKVVLSIALVLAMLMSLTACGPADSGESKDPVQSQTTESQDPGANESAGLGDLEIGNITDYGVHKIGFANDDASTAFGAALTSVVEEYCEKIGWELVTADAQCDTAQQAMQVENMITSGCEAILMKPYDESSAGPISTACQEAGIPLILLTSPISTWHSTCVGNDFTVTGEYIGDWIAEDLGTDIRVAYMRGTLASEMFTKLYEAMIASFEENGIEVTRTDCPEGRKDTAMTMMESWIVDDLNFDVLWCDNSDMALGAWEALNAAGKADQVKILCNGGEESDMLGIKDGQLYGAWDGNTRTIAEAAMDATVILLNGGTVPANVASPDHIITLDDVDELMAERGFGQ